MDFAPIWLIVKPVIIPIIGLVGSARTAVLRLKSSKDRALRNTSFLQSLVNAHLITSVIYILIGLGIFLIHWLAHLHDDVWFELLTWINW